MKRWSPFSKRPPGFTLMELLVVMGIIAALAAMLLPAMARVRRHARTVVCLSNLRQLGTAFQMYVNQNNGKAFVAYGHFDNYWGKLLEPYIRGGEGVMYCPEAPENIGYPVAPRSSPHRGTAFHAWAQISVVGAFRDESSYGKNGWVTELRPTDLPPLGDDTMRPMYVTLRATESDVVPLFADSVACEGYPLPTDSPPPNLIIPIPTTGTNPGAQGMHAFCMARHGRAINVVFLDGHARTVPLPELGKLRWHRQWVPTDVTIP